MHTRRGAAAHRLARFSGQCRRTGRHYHMKQATWMLLRASCVTTVHSPPLCLCERHSAGVRVYLSRIVLDRLFGVLPIVPVLLATRSYVVYIGTYLLCPHGRTVERCIECYKSTQNMKNIRFATGNKLLHVIDNNTNIAS